MGIPLSGLVYIYGDTMTIIHNTTAPESTSKKKHKSITNQFIRDGVPRSELLVVFVRS